MKDKKEKFDNKAFNQNLINLFILFGAYICNVVSILILGTGRLIVRFFSFLWRITNNVRKRVAERIKRILKRLFTPIYLRVKTLANANRKIREENKLNGKAGAAKLSFHYFIKALFGKHGVAITIFNYAAPIVCCFFLFSVVTYASSIKYAVKLTVNGEFVGYIENEQVFAEAQDVINERISFVDSSVEMEFTPTYSIEMVGYNETLTKYQIADIVLRNSGIKLEYGYAFYINDTFYGALTDNTRVKQLLADLLAQYQSDNPTEVVQFQDEISCDTTGLFLEESIVDEEWLLDLLQSQKTVAQYYEVEYGDSHTLIGDILDMTQAELNALNPGFTETDLHVGDLILYTPEVPFLSVSVTKTENYNVDVEYETEYYDDDRYYVGTTRTVSEGIYGVNNVTADVTYINGVEVSRNIKKVVVVSEPVAERVAVGTKPTPAGTWSNETAQYGHFIWPVAGGEISQWGWWDGGYTGHSGIDIAAPYGTAIYAGASGVVTLSQWYYGYGYTIMIYHEELGLTTLYGHCSQLYVSYGQYVTQGECIAAMGMTGTATGNHLHFEVRNGASILNPRKFIDTTGRRVNLV